MRERYDDVQYGVKSSGWRNFLNCFRKKEEHDVELLYPHLRKLIQRLKMVIEVAKHQARLLES